MAAQHGQLGVERRARDDLDLAREQVAAHGGLGVAHERLVSGLAVDVQGGHRRPELGRRARGQRHRQDGRRRRERPRDPEGMQGRRAHEQVGRAVGVEVADRERLAEARIGVAIGERAGREAARWFDVEHGDGALVADGGRADDDLRARTAREGRDEHCAPELIPRRQHVGDIVIGQSGDAVAMMGMPAAPST